MSQLVPGLFGPRWSLVGVHDRLSLWGAAAPLWSVKQVVGGCLSNCDMSSYYIEFYNEMGSKLLCHHLTVCLDSEELLSLAGTGSQYISFWTIFLYLWWLNTNGNKDRKDHFNSRDTWKILSQKYFPVFSRFVMHLVEAEFKVALKHLHPRPKTGPNNPGYCIRAWPIPCFWPVWTLLVE